MEILLLIIIMFVVGAVITVVIVDKLQIERSLFKDELGCLIWIFVMGGIMYSIPAIMKFNRNAELLNIQKIDNVVDMKQSLDKTDAKATQTLRDIFSGIYPFIVTHQIYFYSLAFLVSLVIMYKKWRDYVIKQKNKEVDKINKENSMKVASFNANVNKFNAEIDNLIYKLDKEWKSWDNGKL